MTYFSRRICWRSFPGMSGIWKHQFLVLHTEKSISFSCWINPNQIVFTISRLIYQNSENIFPCLLLVDRVRAGSRHYGISDSCKISFSMRIMFSMRMRFEGWTMVIESRYKKNIKCKDFLFRGPLILKLANLKKKITLFQMFSNTKKSRNIFPQSYAVFENNS